MRHLGRLACWLVGHRARVVAFGSDSERVLSICIRCGSLRPTERAPL